MEDIFSVRILKVDSFMSDPIQGLDLTSSDFKKSKIKHVPIIRLFGSTPMGQSVCCYLHGCFPYLMIPYTGPGGDAESQEVKKYLYQTALSLDHALNTAGGRKNNQEHVFKITLMCGRPYYGFHTKEEAFMKVYFYYPSDIKRSCDLLQAGAIMNCSFQPHEAHLSFILQFFLDYNLYGMNLLHSKCTWFRQPIDKTCSEHHLSHYAKHGFKSTQINPNHSSSTAAKLHDVSTLTQIQHFNWNKLRKSAQDSELMLSEVSNNHKLSEDNCLHHDVCSQKCQSLLFKSGLNSPGTALSNRTTCPFHSTWTTKTIPPKGFLSSADTKRLSTCDLEVDILATDILNRIEISVITGKNPGIQSIWEDERARRRLREESSQIHCPSSQNQRPYVISNKETLFLKGLNSAVNSYYMDKQACRKEKENPTILAKKRKDMKPRRQSEDFFKDKDSESASSCSPIVHDHIVSQVLSTSQLWNSSGNSTVLNLLQDMDTINSSDRQRCLYSQNTNDDLESDEEIWDSCETSEQKKKQFESNAKLHIDESFEMTQPWESGIEHLLNKSDYWNSGDLLEDDKDIPQFDGTSDEILGKDFCNNKSLDTTKICAVQTSKSSELLNVTTFGNANLSDTKSACSKMGAIDNNAFKKTSDLGLSKETQANIAKAICKKIKQQHSTTVEAAVPVTKIDHNSNMFSTLQTLLDDVNLLKRKVLKKSAVSTKCTTLPTSDNSNIALPEQKQTPDKTVINLENNCTVVHPTKHRQTDLLPADNLQLPNSDSSLCKNSTLCFPNMGGASVTISQPGVVVASWDSDKQSNVSERSKSTKTNHYSKLSKSSLRPRRSRHISSYVSDPLFETVFENDWEEMVDSLNVQRRVKGLKTASNSKISKKTKTKLKNVKQTKQQEKVFIKWIITNRFKGVHKMKIGLWRIPKQNQVILSQELLELYEQYSPRGNKIRAGPRYGAFSDTRIPIPPKFPVPQVVKPKIPMGRRTKENVVTKFHPLFNPRETSDSSKKPIQHSVSPRHNLFSHALELSCKNFSEEPAKVDGQDDNLTLSNKDVEQTEGEENSTCPTNIFTALTNDNKTSLPAKKLPDKHIMTPKFTKQKKDKVNLVKKRTKAASKKFSVMLHGGRPCKAHFDLNKISLKKSHRKAARKLKYKEKIKRSHVLPVINRTVTPVNQSTEEVVNNEGTIENKKNCSASENDCAVSNIFVKITPFVASETVAMLQTMPSIGSPVDPSPCISNESDGKTAPQLVSEATRSQSYGTLIVPSDVVKTLQSVVQPTSAQVSTVQKHYLPTRRVTRHSVTARMKALKVPEWMCDSSNVGDNSNELDNVLAMLGRQSPIPADSKRPVTPPRPWSPMLNPKQSNPEESETITNINSGFDLDDVSMLNDIEGMEEIIKGVKISASQDASEEDDNLLSHLDALLRGESFATVTADDTSALLADAIQDNTTDKDVNQPSTSFIDILLNDKSLKSQEKNFYAPEPSQKTSPELQQSFILRSVSPTNSKIEMHSSVSKVSPNLKSNVGESPKNVALNGAPTTCVGENFSKTDVQTPSNKSLLCNTRALPNKQSLQEQLHKQMQAVFLQQQMLDNNNFRSADFLRKNPIRQKTKIIMDVNKQTSTPPKVDSSTSQPMQKDILDEAFQHVISDSSAPLSVSEGLSTFDIMLGSSSEYNDKEQSSNTFLYPCQQLESSAVKSEKNISSLNISHPGPILTMPVNLPVSNPLQVLHTHVHHHHHIHSIKNDCNVSSDVSYTSSETQFNEKLLPTLPKREVISSKDWPDKNKEKCFNQNLRNLQAVTKTAKRFMNNDKEFSILLKPTCQNGDERYWLQIQMQHGIPWDGKRKVIKKEKINEEPIGNISSFVLDTTTAKTPYGLMKQSQSSQELNANKDKFTLSTSRKLGSWRRTAPSNTPTICLTKGQNQKTSSGFELSQDILTSNQETVRSPTLPNNCIPNSGSTNNKKRSVISKGSKQAKSKQSRSRISKTNKMDGYCSRFSTVPFVTSQLSKPENNQRDVLTHAKNSSRVTDRQELILNYETGQLEVVEMVSSDSAMPTVANLNKQTSESCISECEQSSKQACEKTTEDPSPSYHSKEIPAIDFTNSHAARPIKEELISMSRSSPAPVSDPSSTLLNNDKEYVVTSTDDDNLSLKLKLTLKKTPSNKSSLPTSASNKEEVASSPISFKRKGKPSCYEEMVKRSKVESTKKTSIRKAPKKKPAKFYILETSISDEFTLIKEKVYFPPLTRSLPENSCSNTNTAVAIFNSTDHLCMVQEFCHMRCKNVIAPVNMHVVVLEEQNVTFALGALQMFHGDVLMKMSSISKEFHSGIIVAPLENEKERPHPTSEPLASDSPGKSTSLQSKKKASVDLSKSCDNPISVRICKGNLATKPPCDVFTAHPAPPSKESVSKFLDASHLCGEGSHSDEPFFSDCGDLQPPSSRMFATLPAYVKIPKTKRCLKNLPDFNSTVSPGFNHWRMVLGANLLTSNIFDSSWISKQVKDLLNVYKLENIDPSDIIATMTKLDTLPILRKGFVPPDKISVAKLSIQPPTFKQVDVWLKKQRPKLKTASDLPEQAHIKEMQTVPLPEISERQQKNTKGTFKPRKVSFELFSAVDSLSQNDTQRQISGEENEGNFSSSEVITPNRFIDADSLSSNESLSMELSPHSETMDSFDFTQTSLIDKSDKGKSSSPSDIATLMGCTEKDSEDVSLTPLLSGQFALSQSSSADNVHARLHSTPIAKNKPSDRNLVYTPIVCASQYAGSCTPSLPRKLLRDHVHEMQQKPHSLNTPTALAMNSPFHSGITGPNCSNSYGFRAPQHDLGEAKSLHEHQSVSVLSMEVHVKTRLDLRPDPELDPIQALFFAVQKDSSNDIEIGAILNSQGFSESSGKKLLSRSGVTNLNTTYVIDELELMNVFSSYILNRDPDILLGYEIQMLSWGYLLDRASHLGFDICRAISRVPGDEVHNRHNAEWDAYGADNMSEIHVVGRIVLNLWRLMRTELALYDYSFESVTFHLMHERHPRYSHRTLTNWWTAQRRAANCRHRAIDYYLCRVLGNLKLITQQDLIGRTSELARLFGIQFYEVLTRGSQFRVESMMLRLVHSLNFVAMSPTMLQRAGMKAPECIPLVMEPESRFYAEPVIVVDFQSLYPSVIIAHNYCYSTCLGRVAHLGKPGKFTFGCGSLNVPPAVLKQLLDNDDVTVAPNGVAFVKSRVRKGVLPLMLEEILNTRIMVKDSMKKCSSAATKRMLDHRQLGLKFIANFTYGYTSANFSGRMPCVEIADSIVHKSRETLERAIEHVKANRERWKARVVYGDTDSMFIALPLGTSRRRAFEVGRQIVDEITQANPRPMKLKLEKIYQPCILQTKKRYVGYAYESEDQVDPIFDAKGIETVRRDGCPAVAKILEKSLRTLFDSRDVSQVKRYTEKQLSKILDGRSALQDCTIAKEYRGAKYYKPGTIVPALVLARKQLAEDKRSEPRIGERVPYVIVHGTPGTQLFRLIRPPGDLLNDPRLRLHGTYYVTKMVLPALDRVMSLVGVDVFQWFRDLPRVLRVTLPQDVAAVSYHGDEIAQPSKKVTISQYFESRHCAACHSLSTQSICKDCLSRDKRHVTAVTLITQSRSLERKHHHLSMICCGCSGSSDSSNINCISLSCPMSYKRAKSGQDLATANLLRRLLQENDLF